MVRLWRTARATGALPRADQIEAVRRVVGWRRLTLDPASRSATLLVPGMRLDLGGIAKGYAADAGLAVLRHHGIDRALVELGGDIVVGAPPPGEPGWRVALHDRMATGRPLELSHAAVSTSGDTEQFVTAGGRRYSHIVDPRTGIGLTDRIAVTVISPSGALSDALSTMVSVLGATTGPALIRASFPGVVVYTRSASGE